MSLPPSILFLSESGGVRANLAASLLTDHANLPLDLQTACLYAAPWQARTRGVLHALGVAPVTEPMPAQQLDFASFDLIVSLDDAADRAVHARLLQAPRTRVPKRLHWPGREPAPDVDAVERARAELEPRIAELLEQGLLAEPKSSRTPPPAPTPRTEPLPPFHGLVAQSAVMHTLFRQVHKAAQCDFPVLIQGETGTGKERVAHAVHLESRRRHGPFVAVNCGTLPEHLTESELFGHVKGAFTGAVQARRGRFELADGGTIFLDEVGDLPPPLQVKLLRVLQERCFEPVGSEETVHVDVRIVSATHRDLKLGVEKGWFREDLYYRLAVLPLEVPALRKRREDIPDIVLHVLETIAKETGQRFRVPPPQDLARMQQYDWPGNVRELINAVQRAVVDASGDEIDLAAVVPTSGPTEPRGPMQEQLPRSGRGRPSKLEPEQVAHALARAQGNHSLAAETLGVGRNTLYRFLNRHGLR